MEIWSSYIRKKGEFGISDFCDRRISDDRCDMGYESFLGTCVFFSIIKISGYPEIFMLSVGVIGVLEYFQIAGLFPSDFFVAIVLPVVSRFGIWHP